MLITYGALLDLLEQLDGAGLVITDEELIKQELGVEDIDDYIQIGDDE